MTWPQKGHSSPFHKGRFDAEVSEFDVLASNWQGNYGQFGKCQSEYGAAMRGWCSDHLYFNMKIYLISRINSLFNEKDLIQILMHGPFYLREKGYYASFDSSWWEKHSGGCNAVWSQYLNPNQKLLQKKKLLVSSGDLKWPEAHLPEVRPGHCFRLNHQQGPKISCFWTFWVIWMAFRGSWNFSHWLNIMGRSAKWPDLRSPI